MTTQTLSRLIIVTVAVGLLTVLLFSGPTTSAAKADKTAPTTPTNLVVTAITDTTVALKWNASTDNSGKFSYRIKINQLNSPFLNLEQPISQTQTTYTATYLVPNSSYSFVIYAVDGSGNRSGDSNAATASTPLLDNTPPSAPVLQATAIAPSQVQLTWTASTDNVPNNCCSYSLNMNGSPLTQNINYAAAPAGSISVIIRHLSPNTNFSFNVTAIDFTGVNKSTSNSASATTWPSVDSTPPSTPTNLHVISFDNGGGEAWVGWTQSTDDTDAQNNIEYEIYVNGVLSPLPVSAGVDFDFLYTLPVCQNTVTIKAVDKTGNTSPASNSVILKLGSC
jgi:chitodextrinase